MVELIGASILGAIAFAGIGGALLADAGFRQMPPEQMQGAMNDLRAGGLGSVADHYGY